MKKRRKCLPKKYLGRAVLVWMVALGLMLIVYAASAIVDGWSNDKIGLEVTGEEWSYNGDTLECSVTATEKEECGETSYTAGTSTLSVQNIAQEQISFSVVCSNISLNGGSLTVAEEPVTSSTTKTFILDVGGSINIVLTSNEVNTNAASVNIKILLDEKVTTTFLPAEIGGTYTVGGTPITESTEMSHGSAEGLAVTVTSDNDYKFLGWYSETKQTYVSKSAVEPLICGMETMRAVFVKKDSPVFEVGKMLFEDLTEADTYAKTNGNKIVLVGDGILLGSHTISSGNTLLIPFDDVNTIYTTNHKDNGGLVEGGTTAATGPYRTLTMASGANITVNDGGSICLSAKLNAPGGGKTNAGAPTGKVPYIVMQGTSNITLNSGAYLYCYGFITGSGSVTVNSGATVYECFQIRDYRGGNGSSSIKYSVFPSSQYYVQNVEVPMIVKSGGILKGVSAVTVSMAGVVYMNDLSVIGPSGSLFTNSGTVTKSYDGVTDRLVVDIAGNATLGSIALNFGYAGANINSANFVLGLNNNMSINITSGTTTVNQRLALQPGVELNIASGAEVALSKNVYVYDAEQWGDYIYCESMTAALGGIEHTSTDSMQDANNWAAVQVAFAPGKKYTRTLDDLTDAQIDVNGTLTATAANLYTTSSGANIISSEGTGKVVLTAGTETITYQADMNSSSNLSYYEIPITSAQLHNGEKATKTYTETATATAATTYYYCKDCTTWVTNQNAVAQVMIGETSSLHYHTLAETVTAYGDPAAGKYIQMLGNTEESVTLKAETALDLNGKKITGITTISGAFYGADTSGNGYAVPSGSIKLSAAPSTVAHVNGRNYVALYDEASGCYTFHRFEITPTCCMYYLNENAHSHLAFEATVQGDPTVLAKMTDVGFCVSGSDGTGGENWYREAVSGGALPGHKGKISFVAVDFEDTSKFGVAYSVTAKAKFENGGIVSGAAGSSVSFDQAKTYETTE